VSTVVTLASVLFLLSLLHGVPQHLIVYSDATASRAVVAIEVSGAPRGQEAGLRRFAASLLEHIVKPTHHAHGTVFDAFLWLQDDAAEAFLHRLLVNEPSVLFCTSRSEALSRYTAHAGGAWLRQDAQPEDEAAAIMHEHPPSQYGYAWHAERSFNTLRMLHKLRGVERLRSGSARSSDNGGHQWVLRIRPDLELTSPLPLPLVAFATAVQVFAAWICEDKQLVSDQLLLLPARPDTTDGDNANSPLSPLDRLAQLYEPEHLLQTSARSVPPSLYPERLFWHALHRSQSIELHPWHGAGFDSVRLIGADGSARNAYAKLQADFPSCFS